MSDETSKAREKSLKNLKPVRSENEAREKGKKGGIKSGEVRRAKKTMREIADYLMEKEETNEQGELITIKEAAMAAAVKKALGGDIKALEFIRDTIGEKPIEQHSIMQIEPPVIIDDIE